MMRRPRVIPVLLYSNKGLVKTTKYSNPKYLGDPINIVRIFNDKCVDELILLDINASLEKRKPLFDEIRRIAEECFIPLGYGGGIREMADVKRILQIGVEKIVLNSYVTENLDFISQAADFAGSSSVVISIDVKKRFGKYRVYSYGGKKLTKYDPFEFAKLVERKGAGEIIINSIDYDGMQLGYNINLIKAIAQYVKIPVIASCGARNINDMLAAVKEGHADAVAAGSFFVYRLPQKAVLIKYPSEKELNSLFADKIKK